MTFGDRYDLSAIAIIVVAVVLVGLIAHLWLLAFLAVPAVGNYAASRMRRRAGLPPRTFKG
jgi:hypothetical protein